MTQLLIIILYLLIMVLVGVFSRRKAPGAKGFFVADRKQSTPFVVGSLVATIIGASATLGMAGLGFVRGLTGMWWLLVGSVGLLALGFLFARRVREYGLYTLPELLEKQYGSAPAVAAGILIVIAWLGVIAGQILASGQILSVLGMGDPLLWMVVFTVVFVSYTAIGGQYAVIRTDVIQAVLIFIGMAAGLVVVLGKVGWWSGLQASLPADYFSFPVSDKFGGIDLLSFLLLVGLTYFVGPDMYSRLFSARDAKVAQKSAFWAAGIIVPAALIITLFGMAAAVLFPQISPEQAFPTVIRQTLPPVLGGLVLAALLSAVMSSADTCLLTASTILTVDIVKRFYSSINEKKVLLISRWTIVVLGALSLALALYLKGIINALLFAYTIYTGGVILPVIVGFYRKKLNVNSAGALAAIIGGGLSALASKLFHIRYLDLGSLVISVALLFLVSFITRQRDGESSK